MPDEFPNELKRWVHTSPSRCWWAHSLGESPGECSTNRLLLFVWRDLLDTSASLSLEVGLPSFIHTFVRTHQAKWMWGCSMPNRACPSLTQMSCKSSTAILAVIDWQSWTHRNPCSTSDHYWRTSYVPNVILISRFSGEAVTDVCCRLMRSSKRCAAACMRTSASMD